MRHMLLVPAMLALAAAAAPPAGEKAADPDRKICKTEGATGSRLGAKKVCLTAWQWEERKRESQKFLTDRQAKTAVINDQ